MFSQPVGLGLLVELQTSGVEHPADILADARCFVFDAFEVSSAVGSLSKLLLWFSVRRLRHYSSHSTA